MPYGKPKAQTCNNPGCGTLIVWDNNQMGKYKFVEINNGQLHECHYSKWWRDNHPEEAQQQPQRNTANEVLQQGQRSSGDLQSFMNDTAVSIQSLHGKIDKLLEVHTVTSTVEFRKADTMKHDQGNEVSGSDSASGTPDPHGIINAQLQEDEETAFDEDKPSY